MKYTITIFLLFITLGIFGQDAARLPYKVIAPSGMKMREATTSKSKVVTYVPKDSVVEVDPTGIRPETIENIQGHWVSVSYKGQSGYMFDGFLEQLIIHPEVNHSFDSTRTINENESLATSSSQSADTVIEIVQEPVWSWTRTQRDEIESNGSLESAQIKELALALRTSKVPTDSIINVLYQQPTRGAQDSIIAWLKAGRPDPTAMRSKEKVSVVKDTRTTPVPVPVETTKPIETTPKEKKLKFEILTESFNYCGDVNSIDPSKIWYAMYPGESGFTVKRIELQVMLSKVKITKKLEFDIMTNRMEGAYFMFSSSKTLDTSKVYQWLPEQFPNIVNTPLLPGVSGDLPPFGEGINQGNVMVYATGNVIDIGKCTEVENYQLKINAQEPGREIKQTLNSLFSTMGDCNIPELYWFGDLNEDNYTDLIFVSPGKEQNVFTLLLSDLNLQSGLYRVESEWTLSSCK